MTEESARVYLYGVIRDGEPLVLDVPPINGERPVRTIAAPRPGRRRER